MIYLNIDHIKMLHKKMIDTTGGSHGIRDEGLLDSAIENAFATFDGSELYPSIFDKAAATCYSIISNHPFIDGNKRTGIFVMLVLLELNDVILEYSQDDLISLGLEVAKGNLSGKDVKYWIDSHLAH
jgi:death on curing protein